MDEGTCRWRWKSWVPWSHRPGAEHAQGRGSQAPDSDWELTGGERLTHSGDRKRDDVMQLVSGEEWARTPVHTDRISTL